MKLQAVIFDWAGTTVDYGCFAPTGVFREVFRQRGIEITEQEARAFMGMYKRDHIKAISALPRVTEEWNRIHGKNCTDDDIEDMFRVFVPLQISVIDRYSKIVPELPRALEVIRSKGLKIGSTTGYTTEMMDILSASAAKQGYVPDAVVCATDVREGRPAPWMAFRAAEMLGVYPMEVILKIGDTVADIHEGINAGMWSVGVIMSGNEMALTTDELAALEPSELEERRQVVKNTFINAGADYIIDTLDDIGELIDKINLELYCEEKPGNR